MREYGRTRVVFIQKEPKIHGRLRTTKPIGILLSPKMIYLTYRYAAFLKI